MPATSTLTTDIMLAPLRRTIGYAELLVKDIPAADFGHMPHPRMNHPAFCIGHLSLYPNRLFGMIGRPDLVVEKAGWEDLFKAGTACVEQDGRYPAKDELVNHYMERYNAIALALPEVADETLAAETPNERLRSFFPTIGVAANFMLNNHNMMHLGQISAWRRAMGLPSVM
jgi:hypothetical protein